MANTSKKKKSKQDDKAARKKAEATAQTQEQKALAKAEAKAAAKVTALLAEAAKARKTADVATRAAEKAEAKAAAAGGSPAAPKPDEAELLKLALRSTEARLTEAERKVEQLERQIADFHTLDDQIVEEALEDAIVDAAVQATVEEAVLDAEIVAGPATTAAEEAEGIAEELDQIVTQAEVAPEQPSHDGDAAEAAAVFERADAAADPAVAAPQLTPPLPEQPADTVPSESWTLLRLREEAKRRGLAGTSSLPKAALLARLRA